MIRFACPNCCVRLKADDHNLGKLARCPKCRSPLEVPCSIGESIRLDSGSAGSCGVVELDDAPPAQTPMIPLFSDEKDPSLAAPLTFQPAADKSKAKTLLWSFPMVGVFCAIGAAFIAIAVATYNENERAAKEREATRVAQSAKQRTGSAAEVQVTSRETAATGDPTSPSPPSERLLPPEYLGVPEKLSTPTEEKRTETKQSSNAPRGVQTMPSGIVAMEEKESAPRKDPKAAQLVPPEPSKVQTQEEKILETIQTFIEGRLPDRTSFKIMDRTTPFRTRGFNKKPADVMRVTFQAKNYLAGIGQHDFLFVVQGSQVTEHAPTALWIAAERARQAALLQLALLEAAAQQELIALSTGNNAFVGRHRGAGPMIPSSGWSRGSCVFRGGG